MVLLLILAQALLQTLRLPVSMFVRIHLTAMLSRVAAAFVSASVEYLPLRSVVILARSMTLLQSLLTRQPRMRLVRQLLHLPPPVLGPALGIQQAAPRVPRPFSLA